MYYHRQKKTFVFTHEEIENVSRRFPLGTHPNLLHASRKLKQYTLKELIKALKKDAGSISDAIECVIRILLSQYRISDDFQHELYFPEFVNINAMQLYQRVVLHDDPAKNPETIFPSWFLASDDEDAQELTYKWKKYITCLHDEKYAKRVQVNILIPEEYGKKAIVQEVYTERLC